MSQSSGRYRIGFRCRSAEVFRCLASQVITALAFVPLRHSLVMLQAQVSRDAGSHAVS